MKAYRKEDKFNPVILELENQAEVDALYAISNFIPIIEALRNEIDIIEMKAYLQPFMKDYIKYNELLDQNLYLKPRLTQQDMVEMQTE